MNQAPPANNFRRIVNTTNERAPLRTSAFQEHTHILLARSRTLLRVLAPLTAFLTLLTATGLIVFPAEPLGRALFFEAILTTAMVALLVMVELETRHSERREPTLLGKQIPWLLALLFLTVTGYFSIAGLHELGWGVVFAFGLFAVAGVLPMPVTRVAPLFLVYYILLIVSLMGSLGEYRAVTAVAIGAGAAMLLALFVNYEVFQQSVQAIHRNLILKDTNRRLSGTIERNQQLLSIVSHDVRAPLGSIVQLFDFVEERRERFSPSELAEIMTDVTTSLRTSYQLLDNLLAWARSVSSTIQIIRKDYPLDVLIHKAIQPVLLSAQHKEVSINREIDLGLEVVVDKRMIEVSFRNFISNAVKFTKPGGTITITGARAFDSGVVIDVTDNGIGMTEEEVERLLRADHNPSSRVGTAGEHGSGLGFELARHFLELNAGSLEIKSAPNQGTTVRVHLPGGYNPELAALSEEEQLPPE